MCSEVIGSLSKCCLSSLPVHFFVRFFFFSPRTPLKHTLPLIFALLLSSRRFHHRYFHYEPRCGCTSADKYTLTYPPEATVEEKLLLLSGNFLVDFMVFEWAGDKHTHTREREPFFWTGAFERILTTKTRANSDLASQIGYSRSKRAHFRRDRGKWRFESEFYILAFPCLIYISTSHFRKCHIYAEPHRMQRAPFCKKYSIVVGHRKPGDRNGVLWAWARTLVTSM